MYWNQPIRKITVHFFAKIKCINKSSFRICTKHYKSGQNKRQSMFSKSDRIFIATATFLRFKLRWFPSQKQLCYQTVLIVNNLHKLFPKLLCDLVYRINKMARTIDCPNSNAKLPNKGESNPTYRSRHENFVIHDFLGGFVVCSLICSRVRAIALLTLCFSCVTLK